MVKKENKKEVAQPHETMARLMKQTKDDHFNFVKPVDYTITSGSLNLDTALDGGFGPGFHRFCGHNNSGKTALALEVQANFIKYHKANNRDARGLLIRAEGRLNQRAMERMNRDDIKYVTDPAEWEPWTVLIVNCQKYEVIANYLVNLVRPNESETLFNVIIDSMDGLKLKSDEGKTYGETNKVAGAPAISKRLLTDLSLEFNILGHQGILISQKTSAINIDPSKPSDVKDGNFSGGNALAHYANWILEFSKIFKSNIETEGDEKVNKVSRAADLKAHTCKITIIKSMNETNYLTVEYLVKHRVVKGSSVWREQEIIDQLLLRDYIKASGAWITFPKSFVKELKDKNLPFEEQFNGEKKLRDFLEENPALTNYLFNKFKNIMLLEKAIVDPDQETKAPEAKE